MSDLPNGFTGFSSQNNFRHAQSFAVDPKSSPGDLSFDPEKLTQISEEERRWAWIEVDLSAIRHNIQALRQRIDRRSHFMAVVKADGYGHGAVQVAKTALNSGADYLGVATINEAIQLREGLVNAPILVLSEAPVSSIPLFLAYKVTPTVYTPEFAIQYGEMADAYGVRAPYHLKINTGMNRLGIRFDDVVEFMTQVSFHRALELEGTFTHYATADQTEVLDFQIQTKRFIEAINAMRAAGVNPGIIHSANSAAAIRYPDVHFDMARVGIAIYGLHPSPHTRSMIDLKPAMSIKSRIVDVHTPPMSEGVGYGMRYRSPGNVRICTLPLGYGDGLPRAMSGKFDVILEGQRCHQVGTICMDAFMFEVDMRVYGNRKKINPQIGDEVTVVGRQGDMITTLDDMAGAMGTISYELAAGFGQRLSRVYLT